MTKSALVSVFCLYLGARSGFAADPPAADSIDVLFRQTLASITAAKGQLQQLRAAGQPANVLAGAEQGIQIAATDLTPYLAGLFTPSFRGFLSELEEERLDKQVGTAASGAGSTSVVSQGSVPGLFGFAVENGALTRDVSGTTITFRGSPANIYEALRKQSYLEAGPAIPPLSNSFQAIAKRASFYVSFDTSRGNSNPAAAPDGSAPPGGSPPGLLFRGDRQQLAGAGFRYDFYNKRDPRRPEYQVAWTKLLDERGKSFINSLTVLMNDIIRRRTTFASVREFLEWQKDVGAKAVAAATDDELKSVLRTAFESFKVIAQKLATDIPELEAQMKITARLAEAFYNARNEHIAAIMGSWTIAGEYNYVAQANTNGTATLATGEMVPLPDLSNVNFVASKKFVEGVEFTFNGGATWFSAIPAQLKVGLLRDLRASAQLDFPLAKIENIGRPVLSVAGMFMSLREESLGQKVSINGVDITTKGNIGLLQAKLKIPTKNSGVSFPISVTWANRTELIKEKEIRANIGVTFDFDKIFAKP